MINTKENNKKLLISLIKKLKRYEYNLSKNILKYLENIIIGEYFLKYRVEIWYCFIHDQGFMIEFSKNDEKIEDIYTKTCCNYCHIEFIDNFNQNFIKNYYGNHRDYVHLDFKLSWYLNCFYDYKKDEFIGETPIPIKLLFKKEMIRNK